MPQFSRWRRLVPFPVRLVYSGLPEARHEGLDGSWLPSLMRADQHPCPYLDALVRTFRREFGSVTLTEPVPDDFRCLRALRCFDRACNQSETQVAQIG
jgi:hypothetical protein